MKGRRGGLLTDSCGRSQEGKKKRGKLRKVRDQVFWGDCELFSGPRQPMSITADKSRLVLALIGVLFLLR